MGGNSRYILDADGLAPRGRGSNTGMVLVDGQMVGEMRRTIRTGGVTFEVGLFRELTAEELDALHAAGDRYGAFLGLDATVVTAPAARAALGL